MTDAALAKPVQRMTADDVRDCISAQFGTNGEQYSVLFEVRNGTAWQANRSVDAVVMGLWPSLGLHLSGMEIKISRSDWLREYRDPKKASDVFDYFDKWYLVAPVDVAKIEEIPEAWGWLVPENGRLRIARAAMCNPNVSPPPRQFLAAIMRNQTRAGDAPVKRAVDAALNEQRRVHEAEIERQILKKIGEMREHAEQWLKVRDLLKGESEDFIYQPNVIECLRALLKSGVVNSWGGLRSLLAEVDRTRAGLLKIAAELGVDPEPQKVERKRRK